MSGKQPITNGFTLIEILLSLLLISIGCLSIYGVFVQSLNKSKDIEVDRHMVEFSSMVLNYIHATQAGPKDAALMISDYTGNMISMPVGLRSTYTNNQKEFAYQTSLDYQIDIDRDSSRPRVTRVHLSLWPNSRLDARATYFYTELYHWDNQ